MSDTLVWRDDCPEGYEVRYWIAQDDRGHDVIQVQCVERGEPLPAHTSGTTIVNIGDRIFTIDWDHDGQDLEIVDLDMVISLDDEIG